MISKTRLMTAALAVFVLALLCAAARAEEAKPTDEGKGAEFKGKKLEMKDKDQVAILLSFEEGKAVAVTTDGSKETDVTLYVYNEAGKEVGKDVSTGPRCSVKFTPPKDGTYRFLIKNAKGDNTVDFQVKVAK